MKTQREMPFATVVHKPQFVSKDVLAGFATYRDAVVWTWENRVNVGAGEKMDQSMCAALIGLHTPHMSRCVNRNTDAPMNLCPDFLPAFEAYCGWYAVSQFIASRAQFTLMEQVIEERRMTA